MSQTPAESTTTVTKTAPPSKIKGALLRYRVMAWVTGLWLLLLVAELILAYGFDNDSLSFVPIVHGWVYFVYLIMAIDLGIKVRWPIGKAILTLIAGTIPFLSFWVEHKRTLEIRARFDV
ncbi:UNVERIFIED_CONTAM: integral membrane protein [Williamsia faeni]